MPTIRTKPPLRQVDTHYRLPEPLYERLRRYAFDQRRPQAEIVREAVEQHLEARR